MGQKQLLIIFQRFIQNTHSREQRLMDRKKDARKVIFNPLEKRGRPNLVDDVMLKKSKMPSLDHV